MPVAITATGKVYRTSSGLELSDADIEAIAEEVACKTSDVAELKARRDRPPSGSALAEVVPVRLDLDVREAIAARAKAEDTTISEIIRRALRSFLDVA